MRLLQFPRFKAFQDDNSPAAGWKVYSYQAGTTTPQDTYSDESGATPNANPVILDGSGEADIWLDPSLAYKIVIADDSDVVQRTVDNIDATLDETFGALTASTLTLSGAVSLAGQLTSTVATGTAPLVVASTTKVSNLNADKLDGADWAEPLAIGSTTPAAGSFTTLSASSTADVTGDITKHSTDILQGAHGEKWIQGQLSEEITLSTSGTTTDSSANLLPANSLIESVVAYVTETITTATDWKLGDGTTAARFCGAVATLTAGTTKVAIDQWNPAGATAAVGPQQTAAAPLRITTTGTPGAGKIRVTVFYRQFVAPTS